MERKKITFDSFIRGSIGCVLVVGILMLVERLSGVLLPFFIAWLIAYMVYPLVKFFQYKLRLKSRIISIFCSLFLITVIGVTLFYLLVPPMISEIGRMNDLLVTPITVMRNKEQKMEIMRLFNHSLYWKNLTNG